MKFLYCLFITCLLVSPWSLAKEEDVDRLVEAVAKQPTPETMAEIGLKLRGAGKYAPGGERFHKIQSALLSLPGHAEFYAKPIWESYRAYRDSTHPKHQGSATDFSWEAQIGLETLRHLPSPETVKVLGDMLEEEWEADRSGGPRESDLTYPSALAFQAAWTLLDLPLRDRPTPFFERYAVKDNLPAWQAWYERVKSGEIPFSFKGQAVEYRFKPDGTWDTIRIANPPDDAPEVPEASPADRRPVAQETKRQPPGNAGKAFLPYMLAALAALLALVAAWFGFRRMKSRA